MLKFKSHSGYNNKQQLPENKAIAWMKQKFIGLKNTILKLKFGSTTTMPISSANLNEGILLEAGDWHATVMGIFSEKWATWSLVNEMTKAGLNIKNNPKTEKRIASSYGKQIDASIESGYSVFAADKKVKLKPGSIDTVNKEKENYKTKGILLGKRIFAEQFAPPADSRYCEYEVIHSGGSDAKLSTADLKIAKYSKGKMKEEYKYSLKTYLSSGEVTKGTEKDVFGILGLAIGIPSMTAKTFHKHADKFQKEFKSDLSSYAEISTNISNYITTRVKELKSKGIKKVGDMSVADAVKLEAAQKFGHEIIDLQASYFQELIAIGLKRKEVEVKEAILKILDLDENSSRLITSGMEGNGQLVTWERSSPELDLIMSTPIERIDITIDAPEKPLTKRWSQSSMSKAIGKNTKRSSNLEVVISIEGIELYRVGSQLKKNGGCQFNSKAFNRKTSTEINIDISEILGATSPSVRKKIDQEMKTPGSTPRLLPSNQRPSLKAVRGAATRVMNYIEEEDIKRISKKQISDAADLVARGMSVEDVMIDYT